jgi:hypothetical protein
MDIDGGARLFSPLAPAGRPTRRAIFGSSALHGLAILLVFVAGLAGLREVSPRQWVMPVNLVLPGKETSSPTSSAVASLPQEKAKEVAPVKPAQAVPVPANSTSPTALRRTAEASPPEVLRAAKPQPKPTLPKAIAADRTDKTSAARAPPHKPAPADELSARLEALARLRQPAPPLLPDPRQQDGPGVSNVDAGSANAAHKFDAAYAVKDFIRAQVERRWSVDRKDTKPNWAVSIHILTDPNGRVTRAQIIDDPRYSTDPAYEDFALSARNAVLLSSPLVIPPGAYDIAKDIVVDFDSRLLSR